MLGVDKAVAEMRASPALQPCDRAQIYLLAAEFYEAAGRYDDAIDAMEVASNIEVHLPRPARAR